MMHCGDILGDEGRKALNACVKVTIFGRPETRRYERDIAEKRWQSCYAGRKVPWPSHMWYECTVHAPNVFTTESDTVDIIDIHDALVRHDEKRCMEKYPKEGPGSDKLKNLIDKRREDIRRECEEATANLDGRNRYSWLVAQRRVRDCFAGIFKSDEKMLTKTKPIFFGKTYNIDEIYAAFVYFDKLSFVAKYLKTDHLNRAEVEREYNEAISKAHGDTEHELYKYSYDEVRRRVRSCYNSSIQHENDGALTYLSIYLSNILPVKKDADGRPETTQTFTIFDIHKTLCCFDANMLLQKYPEDGPGSDELTKLITAHRADLEKEFQEDKHRQHKYSPYEAERRVRDCFVGTLLYDSDIFPTKKGESGMLKINQTYDIFDIQNAIDHFDSKPYHDKYPEQNGPHYDKVRERVNKIRADVEREYAEAIKITDIEHGSGFIIQGHFIITNKHVVESVLYDSKRTQISISNESIRQLPCEVAHYDTGKDLALLFCKDLKLDGQIYPLQLSKQSLLPGMQIFSFGYPISHTGETALFVSGHVAGTKRTFSGQRKAVLNCALNSGNSGGPVLCWVKGELKVVGVATQKHFKEILTLDERQTVEKIRETLQTSVIPEVSEFEAEYSFLKEFVPSINVVPRRSFMNLSNTCFGESYALQRQHDPRQIPLYLLTLKLYDALETHSQFNLSNAVLGDQVVEFIKDCISACKGDYHEELTEVINGVLL